MADSKSGRALSGDQHDRQSESPRTLMQAHDALVRLRPKGKASLAEWKSYYERSAALYREIAEIDRGHHHEALYWADREQRKVTEITTRISAGESGQLSLSVVEAM
ncbi:MAG: AMED_5909 family protein [Pseudonocardiaceae bacterium]